MTWPWSPAHAEDIAADAVAAREAFLAGTPLDDALQLHVTSKGADTEKSRAEIPPAEESTWASDPERPINWGALIEAYRQRTSAVAN
jgi:hypothetical protein